MLQNPSSEPAEQPEQPDAPAAEPSAQPAEPAAQPAAVAASSMQPAEPAAQPDAPFLQPVKPTMEPAAPSAPAADDSLPLTSLAAQVSSLSASSVRQLPTLNRLMQLLPAQHPCFSDCGHVVQPVHPCRHLHTSSPHESCAGSSGDIGSANTATGTATGTATAPSSPCQGRGSAKTSACSCCASGVCTSGGWSMLPKSGALPCCMQQLVTAANSSTVARCKPCGRLGGGLAGGLACSCRLTDTHSVSLCADSACFLLATQLAQAPADCRQRQRSRSLQQQQQPGQQQQQHQQQSFRLRTRLSCRL